jgi:hypothetical protein
MANFFATLWKWLLAPPSIDSEWRRSLVRLGPRGVEEAVFQARRTVL